MTKIISPNELKLGIAGIILSISSDVCEFALDDVYLRFIAEGEPEVSLYAHYGNIPECNLEEEVFNSKGVWSLWHSGEKYILRCCSPALEPPLYKLAILAENFESGDIYVRALESENGLYPNPLEYPLDEVLMVNLLSLGRGILLHACGVAIQGRGMLFVGASGAGKSTLTRLWKGEKDTTILSDDRIIVRRIGGRFWMYGTPWHGDARVSSPEGVPLEKIFFIKHAKGNVIADIRELEAASLLLVRSFPTFWNQAGMGYTLQLCAELSKEVPCYELGFVPDESVLTFVRSIK